jgi:hypothetical protein
VEAVPGDGAVPPFIDVESARSLLVAMGDREGVALQCPDRVALQLRLTAADPTRAMCIVSTRWREATAAVGLGGWDIVRVEVTTSPEFERSFDAESP